MKTIVSLEGYFPPEFLSEEAYDGTKADIWRVGAMTYLLLSGKKPFDTDIPMASRIQLIQGGKVDFPAANWAHVSREARDFVLKLIHPDPATRLSGLLFWFFFCFFFFKIWLVDLSLRGKVDLVVLANLIKGELV